MPPPSQPYPDLLSLAGRIVVLTGGAGLYGRGLTRHLAHAGATLVLAARNTAALQAVADAENAQDRDVHVRSLDQDQESSILALRDAVLEKFGRIDGLVNNAVSRPMKSPRDSLAAWEASMTTNATGLFAITRAFGDAMAQRGQGSIVNIGSIQGLVGPDFSLYEGLGMEAIPDYFFHKAGMLNLTRFFAAYYGSRAVRVNYLAPGGYQYQQPEVFVQRYVKKTFLRRMADNDDLGPPVVFLLSDGARYVTGAQLAVDGGYTAH